MGGLLTCTLQTQVQSPAFCVVYPVCRPRNSPRAPPGVSHNQNKRKFTCATSAKKFCIFSLFICCLLYCGPQPVALRSGIAPGRLGVSYKMLGIKPGSVLGRPRAKQMSYRCATSAPSLHFPIKSHYNPPTYCNHFL